MSAEYERVIWRVAVYDMGNKEMGSSAMPDGLKYVVRNLKSALGNVGYIFHSGRSDTDTVCAMYRHHNFGVLNRKKVHSKQFIVKQVSGYEDSKILDGAIDGLTIGGEPTVYKVEGTNFYFTAVRPVFDVDKYALVVSWCGYFLINLRNADELPICITESEQMRLEVEYRKNRGKVITVKLVDDGKVGRHEYSEMSWT